jgi:hypothetical protein
MLQLREGQVVREHIVVRDPNDPRVGQRFVSTLVARVDPGGDPRVRVTDTAGAGRLARSVSYRGGGAWVMDDPGPGVAALCSGNWTATRDRRGFAMILDGLCQPGSRGGRKYGDSSPVYVVRRGEQTTGRWGQSLPQRDQLQGPLLAPKVGPIIGLVALAGAYGGARYHDLGEAATGWGVPVAQPTGDVLEDLRAEARTLAALYLAAVAEAERWGLPADLGHIVTPGSLAGVLLASTGMPPLAGRFKLPDRIRAAGAMAYHGSMHAAFVLQVPIPAVHVDISAAHMRGASAFDATHYLTASRIELKEVTERLRHLLGRPDLGRAALDRRIWRQFGITLARVRPRGDLLPAKQGANSRVAWLDLGGDDMWVHWQDAVASVLRGGRPLEVIEAIHLRPVGKAKGLKSLRLPSGHVVNLGSGEDLFGALVGERDRIPHNLPSHEWERRLGAAKALANSVYGCFARIDRETVGRRTANRALRFDAARVAIYDGTVERPGPWFWLPLAGAITASTRLVVAAAMAGIEAAGGTVLHVAADSLTIAATHAEAVELIECPGGSIKKNGQAGS